MSNVRPDPKLLTPNFSNFLRPDPKLSRPDPKLSKLGRFLSADPIGIEGGLDEYGYVKGNPTSLIDPDGMFDTYPIYINNSTNTDILESMRYRPVFTSSRDTTKNFFDDAMKSFPEKAMKRAYKAIDLATEYAPRVLQGKPVGIKKGDWWDIFNLFNDRAELERRSDPILRKWFIEQFGEQALVTGVPLSEYLDLLKRARDILGKDQYQYVYGDDAARFEQLKGNVRIFDTIIPNVGSDRTRLIDELTR